MNTNTSLFLGKDRHKGITGHSNNKLLYLFLSQKALSNHRTEWDTGTGEKQTKHNHRQQVSAQLQFANRLTTSERYLRYFVCKTAKILQLFPAELPAGSKTRHTHGDDKVLETLSEITTIFRPGSHTKPNFNQEFHDLL